MLREPVRAEPTEASVLCRPSGGPLVLRADSPGSGGL
jgi:hypothetical protein